MSGGVGHASGGSGIYEQRGRKCERLCKKYKRRGGADERRSGMCERRGGGMRDSACWGQTSSGTGVGDASGAAGVGRASSGGGTYEQ